MPYTVNNRVNLRPHEKLHQQLTNISDAEKREFFQITNNFSVNIRDLTPDYLWFVHHILFWSKLMFSLIFKYSLANKLRTVRKSDRQTLSWMSHVKMNSF